MSNHETQLLQLAGKLCGQPEAEACMRGAQAIEHLESALEALRDIAVMRNSSKRQRVNSERAITWLFAHGYPLEPGGYVPGVGFTEEI
jgi:hypothetical protein